MIVAVVEMHFPHLWRSHDPSTYDPRSHHKTTAFFRLVSVLPSLTTFCTFTRTWFVRKQRQLIEIFASFAKLDHNVMWCVDVPPRGIAIFTYLFVL